MSLMSERAGGRQFPLPCIDNCTIGVEFFLESSEMNTWYQGIVKATVSGVFEDLKFKRSIFQTFWKVYCCAKFLFIELATLDLHNKPDLDQIF